MKTMNNMFMFAGGLAMGVMYKKYERQICRYAKSIMKIVNN